MSAEWFEYRGQQKRQMPPKDTMTDTLRTRYTARLHHALAIAPRAIPNLSGLYEHQLMRLARDVEEAAVKAINRLAPPCPLCQGPMAGAYVVANGEARVRACCNACRYAEGVGVLDEQKEDINWNRRGFSSGT